MDFKLISEYEPGRAPAEAIEKFWWLREPGGHILQTLLGVTGSGKTFTHGQCDPTGESVLPLILSHNKTSCLLKLYSEMKKFSGNLVQYFVELIMTSAISQKLYIPS